MCSFDQPFLLKTKKCSVRLYLELNLFVSNKTTIPLFSKKGFHFLFLHFFTKKFSLPFFLTPPLSRLFFSPFFFLLFLFLFLSSGFCLPLGFFYLRFFHRLFSFASFTLFSLFCFFPFFEHMFFLVPLVLLVTIDFHELFVHISSFFQLLEHQKIFVVKSLISFFFFAILNCVSHLLLCSILVSPVIHFFHR